VIANALIRDDFPEAHYVVAMNTRNGFGCTHWTALRRIVCGAKQSLGQGIDQGKRVFIACLVLLMLGLPVHGQEDPAGLEAEASDTVALDAGATEGSTMVENTVTGILPESLVGEDFLTVPMWQWVSLLVLIFVGVCLDLFVRVGLRVLVARWLAKYKAAAEKKDVTRTLRPIGLFVAGVFWVLTFKSLGIDGVAGTVILAATKIYTSFMGVLSAWRLVHLVAEVAEGKARKTDNRFDDVLVPLLRKTAKIFVVVMGFVYAANALNMEIGPLIASLGIGGLAVGFAARDTVENFFGSMAVILDRPFDIGDWVVVDDVEGTVEAVGFRSTRIRTFYNSQVTVPNGNLVRATVDNYGRRKYRRWKCHIGVQYDTPPESLIAFTEGIRELVRTHPFTRKDYFQVWVNEFADSSINVLIYIFHEVPDWTTELRERERLMVDIMRLADALGVEFAFPTQKVHLYKEEHEDYLRQHESPRSMTDRRAQVVGIRKAQEVTANQKWMTETPDPVKFPEGPTVLGDDELAKYEATEDTKSK